jgi:hypothetical protein
MRQIGALAVGIWYACVLLVFLTLGTQYLSINQKPDHYVLLSMSRLLGVSIAAGLAAFASKRYPMLISICTATFVAILLFGASYASVNIGGADPLLPPLLLGLRPSVIIWSLVSGMLMILIATAIGLSVRQSEAALEPGILGIRGVHWLWLWVPMALWALQIPDCLYLMWLEFALGWHWVFHPSLWFDWRYILYCMFGMGLTALPINFLLTGIAQALESLIDEDETSKAWKFIRYGIGMAIILSGVLITSAYWILWHLPIISGPEGPWWIIR